MMTHHFVITSSLHIKNLKTDKFDDFSNNIDNNSKTHIFRNVISHIITHCEPRHPKSVSADTKCPPAAKRAC